MCPGWRAPAADALTRRYCPVSRSELANRTVAPAIGGLPIPILFDATFYLRDNEDVRRAGIDPLEHYLTAGAIEGRIPVGDLCEDDLHPLIRDLHRLDLTSDA